MTNAVGEFQGPIKKHRFTITRKTSYKEMRIQLIFLLIFFSQISVTGQQNCYEYWLAAGKEAMRNENFAVAIKKYEAASACENIEEAKKLLALDLAKNADSILLKALTIARDEAKIAANIAKSEQQNAERQKKSAIMARRQSEANQLAFIANNELEKGNYEKGLNLAFDALRKVVQEVSPSVYDAFGNAVFYNFAIQPKNGNDPFYEIISLSSGNNFLGISTNHKGYIFDAQGVISDSIDLHQNHILSIKKSNNNEYILTTSADSTAALVHLKTKKKIVFSGHKDAVLNAYFIRNKSQILTISADKTAKIWNFNGKELITFEGHKAAVLGATFSKDGQYILTKSADKTAILWSISGTLLATLDKHTSYLHTADFSDQNTILTGATDNTCYIWDLSGEVQSSFTHEEYITTCRFYQTSNLVMTTSADHNIIIWDVPTGRPIKQYGLHNGKVNGLQPSPTNHSLLSWSDDHNLILWRAHGKQGHRVFDQHNGPVKTAVYTPTGDFILSTSKDNTIKLWNTLGKVLMDIDQLKSPVRKAMFSNNGRYIIILTNNNENIICPLPKFIKMKMEAKMGEHQKQNR